MDRIALIAEVQSLESRQLLAAPVLGSNGTLTVTGSTGADYIAVAFDGTRQKIKVVMGSTIYLYPAASVLNVKVMLGIGADKFDGFYADRKMTVDGEGGNDTIVGGNMADNLIGGLDNDSITGNAGDDSLSGSGGRDYVDGGIGRDRVDGGSGNDILRGGAHNDRMFGGDGADIYYGDGGDDSFYSNGVYSDTINGGSGIDSAYADDNDVLYSVEKRLTSPPF